MSEHREAASDRPPGILNRIREPWRQGGGSTRAARGPVFGSWLVLALVVTAGFVGGTTVPLLGAAAAALIIGTAARTLRGRPLADGLPARLGPLALQASIVALGLSVNLATVTSIAFDAAAVMLISLVVGLLGILVVARGLGIERSQATLVAVGTAICGASAIAAVAPSLRATPWAITRSIAVIFLFNLTAVAAFPVLAHWIGLSGHDYALWAGTAVNDTSSVLAAAFAFGPATVPAATTVKLLRTLMIVPVTLIVAVATRRDESPPVSARFGVAGRVPSFVVAFIAGTAANSLGVVPAVVADLAPQFALLGTVVALGAVGLGLDLREMVRSARWLVVLGLLGWLLVATTSLAVITLQFGS